MEHWNDNNNKKQIPNESSLLLPVSFFLKNKKHIYVSDIVFFWWKMLMLKHATEKATGNIPFQAFRISTCNKYMEWQFFFPFLSSEKLFLSTHPPDVYDSRWIDPKKEHSHNCTAFAQQMLSHEMNYKFIIKWIHAGVLSVYFLTPSQIHRIHRLCLRTISIHICVYMCSSAWNEFARDLLECS